MQPHFVYVIALLLLTGCSHYDVLLNDRLVYEAPTLFTDYRIDDAALATCVEQAIIDANITRAEDLEQLNCSEAGIVDLFGLNRFTGLKQLKLSGNQIRNLVELTQLKALEALWLDGNVIVDPVPVLTLPQLTTLDVSANPMLQCPPARAITHIRQFTPPEHCKAH